MNPLTKNLENLIAGAEQIASRREEISKHLTAIRAEKDSVINGAQYDDVTALDRVGELGAKENFLLVQLDKCEREQAGFKATLLNEANFVSSKAAESAARKQEAFVAQYTKVIAPFFPDLTPRRLLEKARRDLGSTRAYIEIGKHRHVATFYPKHATELTFARQVLGQAKRAMDAVNAIK